MDTSHENKSIGCTVHQCSYHCDHADYCALPSILVGTDETNPKTEQCTDCMSFEAKGSSKGSPKGSY